MPANPSRDVAVHFVTLGCPKNEVDSDRMAASLAGSFDVVDELDGADVAVVNTCSFIREATEESIGVVLELTGGWKTARPGRAVVEHRGPREPAGDARRPGHRRHPYPVRP